MSETECCKTLQVGSPAPAFSGTAVVGSEFQELIYSNATLTIGDEKHTGKYVVFFFYPLDFTFVCPTEIIAFSDRIKEFEELNTVVVGASVDSQFTHLAWKNTPRKEGGLGKIQYPLLADLSKQAMADYGCLLRAGVAARGVFIIDGKGVLQSYTVNNLPLGRSVDEVLRLIRAAQFVEEHGEVCPANWTPGGESMKADPAGAREYFEKVN
jgi:peroxiredoxin 3